MKIHCESIHHYLRWMEQGRHFSFAGYSDAEWYCMLGMREGEQTGLGQVLSAAHGGLLTNVLRRRQGDPRFLPAVPKCLWPGEGWPGLPGFAEGQIDWFLGRQIISVEGWERDMVLDDLARDGGLYPLIRQLQQMNVCLIGPEPLRCTKRFLRWQHFVPIQTPNLHMWDGGIEGAVQRALDWGRPGVYLVSAGVSAAVIIDLLHDAVPDSWFVDCGSIWDAFAGIGGQRQWRADLYADVRKLDRWIKDNLEGKA